MKPNKKICYVLVLGLLLSLVLGENHAIAQPIHDPHTAWLCYRQGTAGWRYSFA